MLFQTAKTYSNYMVIIIAVFCIALMLPVGLDWQVYNVDTIAQIQAPYELPRFVGMPFAFFGLPHSLLDITIGNAINLTMNILVICMVAHKYADKQWHFVVALTMTTPMAINMIQSNNIDWLPLSAFLVADWLAYPLLAMKPQMLAGAALIRFKSNPNPTMLLPLVGVLIASIVIWGAWWQQLGGGLTNVMWNLAPFPFLIPVGLWLLWDAWQSDDEIKAACATPFLVPYFAPYSLVGIHVLLATRYRNAAIGLWVFSWWYMIFTIRLTGL